MLTVMPILLGVTVPSGASVVDSWFRFQPTIAPLEPSSTPLTVPLAQIGQSATASKLAGETVLSVAPKVSVQANPFHVPEVKYPLTAPVAPPPAPAVPPTGAEPPAPPFPVLPPPEV